MRTIATILLLIAVAFAGCSEASEEPAAVDPSGEAHNVQATDTTGVIRGVVVDDTITPLVGADVTIASLGVSATTLEDGSFGFGDLEPGVHVLEASKPGYATIQTTATVEAGVDLPPVVRIQLPLMPGTEPYVVPYDFEGIMTCSVKAGVPGAAMAGGNLCEAEGVGSAPIGYMPLAATPDFLQSELSWRNTQQLGEELDWMMSWDCSSNGGFMCDHAVTGTSPLVNRMDAETMNSERFEGTPYGPDRDAVFRVFAAASDLTAGAFGLTVEQKIESFSFAFYNHVPEEDWSFIEDGEYAFPA